MPIYFTSTSSSTASTSFGFDSIRIELGPPQPPPLPQPLRDACQTLGLTPPLEGWHVVQEAYRRLAKQHHPDAGGDPERMKAINAAYDLLKEYRPA